MLENLNIMDKKDNDKFYQISQIIKTGGVVVFPTETIYGIGVNAFDEEAIKKLYYIKKRPFNKPISLLVSDIDMINNVAKDITELEFNLINEFLPGPLTIILKKKDIIPDIVTSNSETVGVRIPTDEIALELIKNSGVPIATTSCNISGQESKIEIKDIIEEFGVGVDCYIDGGKSEIGVASTVVQVIDGIPNILREGAIPKEEILSFCQKYNLKNNI